MSKSDIPHQPSSLNVEMTTEQLVAFNKLTKEIQDLGKHTWQFLVGWILGGISTVGVIYIMGNYQLFDEGEALPYYLFIVALSIILAGSDIYRHLKNINKRIDKVVDLVTLIKYPQ